MNGFIKKNHRLLFYGTWLLLTILQASLTQLQEDESYYWVYSKFLAWGYFDHPPMIALVIRAGTLFFHNELAVRLGCVMMNLGTLLITEKLIDQKKPAIFYCLAFSLGTLQLGGFLAVPDIPLIFFTAAFLLFYKQYLFRSNWTNALLLGVAATCMLYSKYHAVLIFFFILLSNFSLLRDVKIYAIFGMVTLLFLPHLYWQYQHHWATFTYQLKERSSGPYDISFTTDYLAGQLLIAGPIAGFILWPATFIYIPKNIFERSLKFISIGFLVFFLFSSYKGRVEANWTAPAIIPIIILSHHFLTERAGWRKWLYRLLPLSLLVIIAARIITVVNIIPSEPIVERFFAWKDWVRKHKATTPDMPAVFLNSYSRASEYWFYSGRETYSLNNYYDRQNNYNYWPVEDSLLGKKVYVLDIYKTDSFPSSIQAPLWKVGYGEVNNYHSFIKVIITASVSEYRLKSTDSLSITFNTEIPPYYLNYLRQHHEVNEHIILGFFKNDVHYKSIETDLMLQDMVLHPSQTIKVFPSLSPGNYSFLFAINSNAGMYTANSSKIKLQVF